MWHASFVNRAYQVDALLGSFLFDTPLDVFYDKVDALNPRGY